MSRAYHLYSRKRRWLEYVKDRRKDVKVEIVKWFDTPEEAKRYEIALQKKLRLDGEPIVGLIGNFHDKEQDNLHSKKTKGRKLTIEQRKHISEQVKKAMAKPEVKRKLSEWQKGRHLTEEHKEHIRQSMLKRKEVNFNGSNERGRDAKNDN